MPQANYLARWLLALIFLILFGWVFYNSIEFYQETEKSRWSAEALRNPYLAASQFLQQSDINVLEADSLLKLDSLEGVTTVLITDANQVINPRQLQKVMEWLEKGGNLIVTANSPAQEGDLLLQHFGVAVEWSNDNDEGKTEELSISDSLREYNEKIEQGMSAEEIAAQDGEKQALTSIKFDDDIGVLEVAFKSRKILTHPYFNNDEEGEEGESDKEGEGDKEGDNSQYQPFSWSSSDYGVHLMQFDVGEGLLSIISDPSIWTSYQIKQHDHAFLLWMLISTSGDLAILHPTLRDSIWELLSRHAPEFLIALSLFILLLLWNQAIRFGRIEISGQNSRRSMNEHFSATANYLWQRRAVEHLLQPLRQQVLRRASYTLPQFSRFADDPMRQFEIISRHTGMTPQSVEMAFNASAEHEMSFVQTVRLLKQIEKLL